MIHSFSKAKSHETVGAFYELPNQSYVPPSLLVKACFSEQAEAQAFAAESYAAQFAENLQQTRIMGYDESLINEVLGKLGIGLPLRGGPPNVREFPKADT